MFPRPRRLVLPAVLLTAALAACAAGDASGGSPTGPTTTTPSDPNPTAGVATGTVVDTRGQPLAGVQVIADYLLAENTNAIGATDAQGRYSIDVGQPAGTWHMTAHLRREYQGETFDLYLDPDSDAPFAGNAGVVRNFCWRLTGPRADGLGFYGGTVQVNVDRQGWAADIHSPDIEFTFAPVGPLIDGSTGRTLTLRTSQQDVYTIRDVPIGTYAITARYAPDGQAPRPMVLRWYGQGTYADTLTSTWPVRNATHYPDLLDVQVAPAGD
ncbi:hypothetical protein tb265_12780 [Gemmatimonadetes bacterium T265]|nr:hypothetical protein tb265_12780 [Gemmatimonadetes bacterium T265]